MQRNKK